jgi:arsenite methyltransferase
LIGEEIMSDCCKPDVTLSKVTSSKEVPGDPERVRAGVRDWYGSIARSVAAGSPGSCCGGSADRGDVITRDLYEAEEVVSLPADAVAASLGCGNPTYLAELSVGETVLDLGSGGGIDVLLSARRVGPDGKAYGLDMTDEMLELARRNQREAGITNAEFLKGSIESVPLPNDSVDVIISNCVVNLSPEKERVFAEAYRVLRSGGRLAISDVVFREEPAGGVRQVMALWSACIGGALAAGEYEGMLRAAGFVDIGIEFTRDYGEELGESYPPVRTTSEAGVKLGAAFVRARKP